MSAENKCIFINAIIGILRERCIEKNKKLASENLFWKQEAFDASDMFFKLAFMADEDLNKIARACGI